MDGLTKEVMHFFQYDFGIVPATLGEEDVNHDQLIIPRWDIALLRPYLLSQNTQLDEYILGMQEGLNKHTNLLNYLKQPNFTLQLSLAINEVKKDILQKTNSIKTDPNLDAYAGCYLILARSPAPDFYAKQGAAETPGYGTSRRSLLGIEEAEQRLKEKNIPVRIFEPGKYSLTEQIKVFQTCKGIIAIKGAEFANLIWMKPKTQVILIKPTAMTTPPVQKELACILNLNYLEIEDQQGFFPVLDPQIIESYLR